uniref:Putative ATPase, BadF/BadG/BcrA/BcrD type n=1 Tax=mine drainage metagenome TaxID=410659 RepID=E6Q0Y1_9ZZZZ
MILGIDLGGSKSLAVFRDGKRSFRAEGGPANASFLGLDAVQEVLRVLVGDLDIEREPDAVVLGAAGISKPALAIALEATLRAAFPHARILCTSDVEIALRAAIPHGDGAVLVVGTGSGAYGESGDLRLALGGGGYLLGDEGAGFALGIAAARLLLRSYEGRAPRDAWFASIEDALECQDRGALISAIYLTPVPVSTIAALAPIVLAAADTGERSAVKIVQGAALELADLVRALLRRLDALQRPFPLALCGGLVRENSLLTFLFETRLSNEAPLLEIRKFSGEPVEGALVLAERASAVR